LFDISNRDTFESVERWVQDVKAVARPDVVLILIGNKCDLEASRRQVRKYEALEFAQRYGMKYFEASAKTDAINCCVSLIEKNLETGTLLRSSSAGADDRGGGANKKNCY
jgi:GTPase SAR1 family protein